MAMVHIRISSHGRNEPKGSGPLLEWRQPPYPFRRSSNVLKPKNTLKVQSIIPTTRKILAGLACKTHGTTTRKYHHGKSESAVAKSTMAVGQCSLINNCSSDRATIFFVQAEVLSLQTQQTFQTSRNIPDGCWGKARSRFTFSRNRGSATGTLSLRKGKYKRRATVQGVRRLFFQSPRRIILEGFTGVYCVPQPLAVHDSSSFGHDRFQDWSP
ncbi:MAG: hypothetical protein J3Q66DRAFT_94787 [Benniella sp.]|nr:MAG: hypothetical protein J3Q66DRAFT_94787 [Benniella sp.]